MQPTWRHAKTEALLVFSQAHYVGLVDLLEAVWSSFIQSCPLKVQLNLAAIIC